MSEPEERETPLRSLARRARPLLTYLGEHMVHLDKGTFQWVSLKTFDTHGTHGGATDLELLGALVAHEQYGDDYAGSPLRGQPAHGPYRMDAMGAEKLTPISARNAARAISDWAAQFGDPTDETRRTLDSAVVSRIEKADKIYTLEAMPTEAQHEWGFVVGGAGFHEFVLIEHPGATITLAVASDD